MGRMIKINKLIIVFLVVTLSVIFTGCVEGEEENPQNPESSSTVVNGDTNTDNGIILPEEDFDIDEQQSSTVGESSNPNKQDDVLSSTPEDSDGDKVFSSQSSNTSSLTEKDETSSDVGIEEENVSSDDSSESSENDGESIELPMDKW